MLLFALIYRYLMALRVFESCNLLSYGFPFNIKGLSVKIVSFLSAVPGLPIRGESNCSSRIIKLFKGIYHSLNPRLDHCRVVLQNTEQLTAVALVVLVMGHVTHHKQMDPRRLCQIAPANVDADTCKMFPYVIDMVCMQ